MAEPLKARIGALLRTFGADPIRTTAALRELISQDEQRVVRAAVALLDDERAAWGARSLLGMVAARVSIVRTLIDARELSLAEAVRIAHEIAQSDSRFLSGISAAAAAPGAPAGASERASLITDHRQRADRIEALWQRSTSSTAQVFEQFARDPHHRVRANALLGLHHQGDPRSIPGLVEMTKSPDALFRAAAAWAMRASDDPRFIPVLDKLSADPGRAGLNARKALDGLREIVTERKQHEPWLVEPTLVDPAGSDVLKIAFSVQSRAGESISGLPLTSFVLTAWGEPAWRFSGCETSAKGGAPSHYEVMIAKEPKRKAPESVHLQIFHPRGWGEAEIPVCVQDTDAAPASTIPSEAPGDPVLPGKSAASVPVVGNATSAPAESAA